MRDIPSKLPNVKTTIFTVMSALANEHGAINLSQGFPNFPSSERLIDLVCRYMKEGYNQYAPMAGLPALREQLAIKMDRLYGANIDPGSEITITAGATQAIFTAITAFVYPGDEVITIEPAYDSYKPSIEVNGGSVVPYRMNAPEYKINWDHFKKLISAKTRMIIINNPQNPSGNTLKREDLEALQHLTRNSRMLVLGDEVYEHLIYDGQEHQSILRFKDLYSRSLIAYSFGKTFHNTGWKVGYCVAPEHLTKEFRKVHQFNVFSVNSPIQYALAEFLQDPEEYLSLPAFFQKKRDFFLDTLAGSRLRPLICEGTYFHLFDYSEISDERDTDFAKRMTTEFGVAAIPVSVFYSNRQRDTVIRLCFAKTEETLEKAGKLLREM